MSDKVIVLFVEGATEIEFYKAVIKRAHDLIGKPFNCSFDWADMKGIGNYKDKAVRKFNFIKERYTDKELHVFLCIDYDAFKYSSKPPIDRVAVKAALKKAGAINVTYIEANASIEEWFLCDLKGVLDYLRLPKTTKRPKGIGQDALKSLFKQASKVYIKGGETKGFIEKLNIAKIMSTHCQSLKPLCQDIGLDCSKVCEQN